jgi:secreted protein with Ig-like and vWFA domain
MLFTSPLFLFLLLFLPLLIWLGWPSRGPSRRREILSLGLRLLITLLLIAGLAGLEIKRIADELSVVFLVDSSDSMPPAARQLALGYVRSALQRMGPNDKAGVILFGADALVERPLSQRKELETFTSKVTTLHTDLAGAIRLGLALLPTDTARRLVILSDGIETSGDAFEAARLAAASGTQIVVVPFQAIGGTEALVTDVRAPGRLREGEQFSVVFTVNSTADQSVGIRILAGAAIVHEGALQLRRGAHSYSIPLVAGSPGFAAYRVQLIPPASGDTFYQNNELAAFSHIEGPPKVLLVKNENPRDGIDESKELLAALQASNILVEVVPASGLPTELPVLSNYASVILVDVPARDLSSRQMNAIQTYVRDLGGGLVAVGGPSAYGVGGYFRTPLEEPLRVEMQIKDQKRRARLTLVFIVDKSGSMSDTSGGVTKVELAKEAVIRSVQLLSPTDKVGVIAFDDSASWVVPITPLDDPDTVINRVGTIRADGGTDIFAGVKLASESLPADDSAIRHIILLTDGGADPTGIPELVGGMFNDYGITLSSVAVGRDAAQDLLRQLAQVGGGVYHFADDPSTIPTIFAEETTLATRAYIIEEEFLPQQVSPSPILEGIESAPPLLGYIGTSAKDAAQTILISGQEDPVLASWQYGLGKSIAWTSDATGRWAKNWVNWDQFVRFWAQAVRYTLNTGAPSNTTVQVTREGEQANITVDAKSDAGVYLNGLTMQVNVVGPDGQAQGLTLQQVAPGRYEGTFTPTAEGAYLIRVAVLTRSKLQARPGKRP